MPIAKELARAGGGGFFVLLRREEGALGKRVGGLETP